MASVFNNFESPSSGTTLTTGNTSNADGSTAFDVVTIGTGGTLVTDTTNVAHGGQSLKVATAGTAAQTYAQWTSTTGPFATSATALWGRAYCFFTANPASTLKISQIVGPTNGFMAAFGINSTGKVVGLDLGGTTQITSTASIPLNAWFRIEFALLVISATVGQIELKLFSSPESPTPDETKTSTASLNTGTGGVGGARNGIAVATASLGPIWLDGLAFSDVGYIGPAPVFSQLRTFQAVKRAAIY